MKRPLLLVGLLYVAGIVAGEFLPPFPRVLLAILGGLTLVAIVWARPRVALLYPIIFLAGWTNLDLQKAVLSANDLRSLFGEEPKMVTVRGTLLETPLIRHYETGDKILWRTQSKLEVTAACPDGGEWRSATGNIVILTTGQLTNLFAGQTVEVSGLLEPPPPAVAEGMFDYRSYLARLDFHFQLRSDSERDWRIISSPGHPPLADRFSAWGRRALAIGMPVEDDSLRLEWLLTLGWKPALTEEMEEPFIRAATYHIFAVDGLRMAIIFGIFFGLFRALNIPRPAIGIIMIPVIWFYVALTGWPASAIRATVMLTIVIIGWVLHRPGELINSLFAAAIMILVWQPQQLFQAGFQLSFFVVLCIILTVPVLNQYAAKMFAPDPLLPSALRRRWHPAIRVPAVYVWDVWIVSFAAWLGSIPLVALYFNIVTPVSTPANLVAVPLCALVLMANLASLLLAGWFPAAAEIFNHAGWFFMECIRVSSDWFARWPKAYAYVQAPTFFGSALFYAILIAAVTGWLFKPAFRRWKFAVLSILIAFWGWQLQDHSKITRLTVLPVNDSTAIFFDPPGSKDDFMVDCGREIAVKSTVKNFLRGQGVDRLGGLVLSYGAVRKMGGATALTNIFPVARIYASSVRSRSPEYRKFIAACEATPGQLMHINRGDKLGSWTVLHPGATNRFPQGDDNAIVLFAMLGGAQVLLLSDLGQPGQKALLERNPSLRADIVVTGLPNRGEAISEAFLNAVQPRLIVVTDVERPVQQRAKAEFMARLASNSIPVLYTRFEGAVTLEFKGEHWTLRTREGTEIRGQKSEIRRQRIAIRKQRPEGGGTNVTMETLKEEETDSTE